MYSLSLFTLSQGRSKLNILKHEFLKKSKNGFHFATNQSKSPKNDKTLSWNHNMSHDMIFPTMWYVRPAKPQISLRIRAV